MAGGSNMIKGDYIPDDIIADIRSKLPAKSVLRFRIACKTWYSLISDPLFINLHSKQTSQNPKILYSKLGSSQCQLLDYEDSLFDDYCLSGPIKFPGRYCRRGMIKIVGSSCGLVCAIEWWITGNFFTWNPLTEEYRNIPNCGMNMKDLKHKLHYYFHGLGYDSVPNDFKLVISLDKIRYNIFSLKENSWKTIRCPLIASENYNPDSNIKPWNCLAIVLNGIFHWLVKLEKNDYDIVAFDVHNETFQKLQLPQRLRLNYLGGLASLLEHKGCLCISFNKYESSSCPPVREIWMMKEYGVWIHSLTIKLNSAAIDCFHLPVLCISSRSEVVSHTDVKFSKRGQAEEDKLDEKFYTCPYTFGPVKYVQTLVSPNANDRPLQGNGRKYTKRKRRTN